MANTATSTFTMTVTTGSGPQVPASGPIGMDDIQSAFPVSPGNPIRLSEYYAGGGRVPNPAPTSAQQTGIIPTAGKISIGNFRGVRNSGPLTLINPVTVYGSQGGGDSLPRDYAWAGEIYPTGRRNTQDLFIQFGATGGTGNYTFSHTATYDPSVSERYTITMNYNGFKGLLYIKNHHDEYVNIVVTVDDGPSTDTIAFSVNLWW